MSYYLHEYTSSIYKDGDIHKGIDEILSSLSLESLECGDGDNLNSYIVIGDGSDSFDLSEYPGNCTALILHGVEQLHGRDSDKLDRAILASIAIGEFLGYGIIWVTGTNEKVLAHLVNRFGFVCTIYGVMNPHSGNENYFAAKVISK